MGWWNKLFGRSKAADEAKAVDISPDLWAAINGGWGVPTKSGTSVSSTSALQNTAYYRGILTIAQGIAQLPVEIYRPSANGKGVEPAVDHPLYELLMLQASDWQDAPTFVTTILMHAAGTGNSVSYKVMVNGRLRELIPIRPELVQIDLDTINRVTFQVSFEDGTSARLTKDQVFHVTGPSWRPYLGQDPAVVGREAIGLAQATEETHARLHSNGARPGGILSTDQKLDKDQVALLKEQWQQTQGGVENAMKTALLSGGVTWKPLAMTGVDNQHIETRKHQIEEIARLLGVFPIMLGHAGDQSPTFASADAFLEAHVRYTLQPWIRSLRAAIETQLLTREEWRAGYRCRIDTSELLRGSLKDRTEYYKAALGTNSSPGWLGINEVREDDGWESVLEGEQFDRPVLPSDYAKPSADQPAPADPKPAVQE